MTIEYVSIKKNGEVETCYTYVKTVDDYCKVMDFIHRHGDSFKYIRTHKEGKRW